MKKKALALVLTGLIAPSLSGCQDLKRMGKDFDSGMRGLDRTLRVYSHDGDLLSEYSGTFDILVDKNGSKVKFDLDGKRTMIYNAIVIVEED